MREFTVIIPTWNMGRYLEPLFQSIVNSPFATIVEEIIFVCERSTDGSEEIIAELAARQGDKLPRITLIQPATRRGLFMARYLGAKTAQTARIMFIDSRITLPEAAARALPELAQKYPAMIANVDIDAALTKTSTVCTGNVRTMRSIVAARTWTLRSSRFILETSAPSALVALAFTVHAICSSN